MKKFKFSLQKVLDVNIAKEKNALEEFAKAQNLVLVQKTLITELELEYKSLISASVVCDGTAIYDIQNRQAYAKVLQVQISNAKINLKRLESELVVKRQHLIEAMKNRKLLENLKTKARDRYKKEQEHEEQLFLDEIGVIGYSRKEGDV